MSASTEPAGLRPRVGLPENWELRTPDEVALRRFGYVRAVGGAAYFVAVGVLIGIYGWTAWPLVLGVPVLAVVTTAYFAKSNAYPRTAVIVSLAADAFVLGGGVAFLGGSGSGLVLLYSIVIVSAGLLLGPSSALAFTGFTVGLSFAQLGMEQLGLEPALLHRPALEDRLPVLLVAILGLASVGYLSSTYGSRLHELVVLADLEAQATRRVGRRRRQFLEHAAAEVRAPLAEIEAAADTLDEQVGSLSEAELRRLGARLRMALTRVDAEVDQLVDAGILAADEEFRPQPIRLRRVVDDCLVDLGERLEGHTIELHVGDLKVQGDRRGARRVVLNLLENVVEHTPPGTTVRLDSVVTAGHGILAVTDDGPGVPSERAARLFDPPPSTKPRVGLGLVRELCEAMGAVVRYEPAPGGGARFLVSFRLAPTAAPSADDERT